MTATLMDIYERLFSAYGPQHWWPGETPFEVMVGAMLVQNTAWKNTEKAIRNLADNELLSPQDLYDVPEEELAELIHSAGYYRMKARRLRNLLKLVVEDYQGSLDEMFQTGPSELRERLLSVNGVGPETADSILLYAAGLPSFVVDTYTHRVFARHGWIGFDAGYDEIKEHFQSGLEEDVALYNEYHALLVRVGHLHCRKRNRCEGCPLEDLLPHGGPLEPGDF